MHRKKGILRKNCLTLQLKFPPKVRKNYRRFYLLEDSNLTRQVFNIKQNHLEKPELQKLWIAEDLIRN